MQNIYFTPQKLEIFAHPRYQTQGAHFDYSSSCLYVFSSAGLFYTRLLFVAFRGAMGN